VGRSCLVLEARDATDGGPIVGAAPDDPLRPSEYTAILIEAMRADAACVAGARVLEIGYGSGVVLAAAGALGATQLCGVDVEGLALDAATRLLHQLGYAGITSLFQGDMWAPVAGLTFELVVANLPHFPTENGAFGGRLPSWSRGGPDGRALLDRFIAGVATYLAPGGRALLTHNAFIDMERSRELAAQHGLYLRVINTTLLCVPPEKLRAITTTVLKRESNRTILCYGDYCFGEMSIVELSRVGNQT
jgi:release factor glutamine methyltransferase